MPLCSIRPRTRRGFAPCTPIPPLRGAASAGWCSDCARTQRTATGFTRVELAATMAGVPLYRACGYGDLEAFESDTPSGVKVPLIRMGKRIA